MSTRTSVMATMVYGLVCAVLYIPLAALFQGLVPGYVAWQLQLLLYLAGYGLVLWKLSGARLAAVAMPWVFVFCAAGVGIRSTGFLLLCLASLAWIRSGVCFTRPWSRILPAEALATLASMLFITWFEPRNAIAMSLCVWIFFLIQSLYFFIAIKDAPKKEKAARGDFDMARRRAERILGNRV